MNRSHKAIISACVLSGACASVGRLAMQEPTVALREVRILGLGLSGGTLSLVLDVDNPNPFALRGVGITTDLTLAETPFGTARWDQGLEVPARGLATVEIPLQFTWRGVGAGARSLLGSGSIPYGLSGELSMSTQLGAHNAPFTTAGSVTLRDLVGR